jgi:hypothetical protein
MLPLVCSCDRSGLVWARPIVVCSFARVYVRPLLICLCVFVWLCVCAQHTRRGVRRRRSDFARETHSADHARPHPGACLRVCVRVCVRLAALRRVREYSENSRVAFVVVLLSCSATTRGSTRPPRTRATRPPATSRYENRVLKGYSDGPRRGTHRGTHRGTKGVLTGVL